MSDTLKQYVIKVIELTWGFVPTVEVQEVYERTMQVFISGPSVQRAQIMGREAKSIAALTKLVQIYGSRNKMFVYVYVRPREEEAVDKLEETLKNI